jgi:ribose transport system permease protein
MAESIQHRIALPKAKTVNFRQMIVTNALAIGLILMMFIFGGQNPLFWTASNFRDIALQGSVLGIVAVAGALVILTGYMDLTVGSTLALGAVVTGTLIVNSGWNPFVAAGIGVLAGAVVGAVQGLLTTYFGLSAIIVTLGMLTAIRGLAFFITAAPVYGFGETFGQIGHGTVAGIPIPVLIAAAVFLVGTVFLSYTPGGRHVYAIGVNKEAAYLSGVAVRRLPFTLYILSGASAALGGVIMAARLDSAPPGSLGTGFELDVLTAILLGGVAFTGGRGSIPGVLLGVVFLGVLQNGLTLMNVSYFWQLAAKGSSLVFAAGLDLVSTQLALGGVKRKKATLRDG